MFYDFGWKKLSVNNVWSIRGRTVILNNGDVWEVVLYVFTDGSRECMRSQIKDTCSVIPF